MATVGDLELVVRLPERYAQIVSPQTLGTVRFDTLDGRRFTAGVKRLQPVIDPVSRSKELVFAIPAGSRGVEPGMFGTVELVSRRLENVVVVPFEAVVQETNAAYLFVAHDGAVAKRKVDLGMLAGERVEIRSGVDAGENVVVSGQTFLDDGSPVSIVDQGSGDPGSTRGRSQASPK